MSAVGYYIALPFIYLIAWLPFPVLYGFSTFIFVLVYRVLGYRKKVVRANLENSFPEKSTEELRKIEVDFYRYFADFVVETIKTLTISPRVLNKRVQFDDLKTFERWHKEQRSIIIVMGHLGNWELGGAAFSQQPYHQLFVIYHPLSNKHFDKLVYHMRTRLGNKLYAMKETIRGMIRDKNELTATAFIADQTPSPRGAYWTTFLNQDTPIFVGTAKIAKKLNYPVVYVSIQRPKRGHYRVFAETLIENPADFTEDEISEMHTKRLEEDIQRFPEIWLWTHRRWKHKRPANA